MDFTQLFKTAENVDAGYSSGVFTPTHLTVLASMLATIFIIALIYKRSTPENRARIQRYIAWFVLINEILKNLYAWAIGQIDWSYLPLHLCGMNILLIWAYQITRNKGVAEWLYAFGLPGALVALITPSWSALPVLNIMFWQSNTIHVGLATFPILLLIDGFRPNAKRFIKVLPWLFAYAALIFPLNKWLGTNFLFINFAPLGTPFVVFEKILGNPGYILGFLGVVAVVNVVMYMSWNLKRKASS